MANPIDLLLDEHKVILGEFESLRRAVAGLRERGDQALPEAMPTMQRVGAMMATRLLTHARKEDEALFPALEAVFGETGTPTQVMRMEHRLIHEQADLFRKTLSELNEVEHPAIVAGGEALRELAAGSGNADQLRRTGEEILELVDSHFGKEEQVLFPMARQMLTSEALGEVERKMEQIAADAGA